MKTRRSRRTFLRAGGSLIALPLLHSLGFRRLAEAGTATVVSQPKRIVFLGIGYGVTQETWLPDVKQRGENYTLPPGLAPMARHRADFSIVQGLTNKFTDEAHWGSTFWLTGANRFEGGRDFTTACRPTKSRQRCSARRRVSHRCSSMGRTLTFPELATGQDCRSRGTFAGSRSPD